MTSKSLTLEEIKSLTLNLSQEMLLLRLTLEKHNLETSITNNIENLMLKLTNNNLEVTKTLNKMKNAIKDV